MNNGLYALLGVALVVALAIVAIVALFVSRRDQSGFGGGRFIAAPPWMYPLPGQHGHDGFAPSDHDHDDYALENHDHPEFAVDGHDHDGRYAAAGHDHHGLYAGHGHVHSALSRSQRGEVESLIRAELSAHQPRPQRVIHEHRFFGRQLHWTVAFISGLIGLCYSTWVMTRVHNSHVTVPGLNGLSINVGTALGHDWWVKSLPIIAFTLILYVAGGIIGAAVRGQTRDGDQ